MAATCRQEHWCRKNHCSKHHSAQNANRYKNKHQQKGRNWVHPRKHRQLLFYLIFEHILVHRRLHILPSFCPYPINNLVNTRLESCAFLLMIHKAYFFRYRHQSTLPFRAFLYPFTTTLSCTHNQSKTSFDKFCFSLEIFSFLR